MARKVLLLVMAVALSTGCGSGSKKRAATTASTTTAPIVSRQHGPPVHARGQFLIEAEGLFLVDAATGRSRLITGDRDQLEVPRWSPDGAHVLSAASRGENDDLISYPVAGGRPVNLTKTKDIWEMAGRWSPDGRRIAYIGSSSSTHNDLYVARADGGGARRVARSADGFAWSPDGRRVAFAPGSDRNALGLLVVASTGGRARPLGPDGSGQFIDWGPRGRVLYAADSISPTPQYLWTGTRDTSLGLVDDAQFLPDGTVAFGKGRLVGFVRPDGSRRTVKLVDRPTSYSWSTDGRYLAFASAWSGRIYVARGDGTGIHRLPNTVGSSQIEVFGWRPSASS